MKNNERLGNVTTVPQVKKGLISNHNEARAQWRSSTIFISLPVSTPAKTKEQKLIGRNMVSLNHLQSHLFRDHI